jgi:uncharacterized protein (DUF2141 family)
LVALVPMVVAGGHYKQAHASAVCSDKGVPIRLTVEKVRSSKGTIKAELYGSKAKKTLAKSQKLDRIRVKARQGETHLCLNAPVQGNYSVVIYHDENNNKKFDRNFIGIPKEGFGFSNNPTIRLGLPEQDEILFKVEDGKTNLLISVVYL